MHKVSAENRTQSIKRVAEQISDSEMIFKVTSEDFAENALYHSACIARYVSPTFAEADTLCNFRANLQGGKVQIYPVGGSGRTLSCVSASLLGWWKQIDHFNIIPRELDSTGKKIETDTTLDSLKLHIVLDKSSDITTISSPLHKMMKPYDSPVHDYK
jgi:hypothetical protein